MNCASCHREATVLIVNVATNTRFCHGCASRECPSFLPNFVLTIEDVQFMRGCGIDPEISRITAAQLLEGIHGT